MVILEGEFSNSVSIISTTDGSSSSSLAPRFTSDRGPFHKGILTNESVPILGIISVERCAKELFYKPGAPEHG